MYVSSNKCESIKTETGNRSGIQTKLIFKVCTRRRSWVQQTVDQRRGVVVATQGRRAHWMTIDSSLRFEVSFYESKMYFFYFWSWWSAQWRTQQRFAKLELKKASSTWKTEIWNIQKNADATMVMITRRARAIRGLGLELGVKLTDFMLAGTNFRVRISALTKSWVGDISLDELGRWRFLAWRTREFQSPQKFPLFGLGLEEINNF